jgi:hypothetical protein
VAGDIYVMTAELGYADVTVLGLLTGDWVMLGKQTGDQIVLG